MIPTNWAKHPFDAGPRETVEQIEATGLRYRVTERANNMAVGGWQGASGGGISGLDLMTPFTREFWNSRPQAPCPYAGSIEGVWRFDNCFGTTVIYHFLSNFELSFSSSCFH